MPKAKDLDNFPFPLLIFFYLIMFSSTFKESKVRSEESESFSKSCGRFVTKTLFTPSTTRAMVYLDLRNEGCEKASAIKFAKKSICRTDTTRKWYGPSTCTKLRLKSNPQLATKGWGLTEPEYEIGKMGCLQLDSKRSNTENSEELFINHFKKHEALMKADFKKKIDLAESYYSNINEMFNFSKLSEKKLWKKLETLKSSKSKKSRKYFRIDGIKIKELFEEEFPYLNPNDEYSKSLVRKLNAFTRMLNPEISKRIASKEINSKQSSPNTPSSNRNRFLEESERNSKTLNFSNFIAFSKSQPKPHLNSLLKRGDVYEDFEKGTKLMRKISVAENMMGLDKIDPRSKATLEKFDLTGNASKESRKILAEEFNAASYLTSRNSFSIEANDLYFRGSSTRDDKRNRSINRKNKTVEVVHEAEEHEMQEMEEKISNFNSQLNDFINSHYNENFSPVNSGSNNECLKKLIEKRDLVRAKLKGNKKKFIFKDSFLKSQKLDCIVENKNILDSQSILKKLNPSASRISTQSICIDLNSQYQ